MIAADLRAQLESDLLWRQDELRHLRNTLLGEVEPDLWPMSAIRAILVMQYAHLEGFARNAFHLYIQVINDKALRAEEVRPAILATALIEEFTSLRTGVASGQQDPEHGRLLRRVMREVAFVDRLRQLSNNVVGISADAAVSMDMNFGADVLRHMLYSLGIPDDVFERSYYRSVEFVRKTRNDVSHGSRTERIQASLFEAHRRKCEEFMNSLARVVTQAVTEEWFRVETSQQS